MLSHMEIASRECSDRMQSKSARRDVALPQEDLEAYWQQQMPLFRRLLWLVGLVVVFLQYLVLE